MLKPYLPLNINVCYPPPVISGPIALIKLKTQKKKTKKKNKKSNKKKNKKKTNVVGTPGSNQHIAN